MATEKTMPAGETVDRLIQSFDTKAALFDLDGTLIDNNYYHRLAWIQYLRNHGMEVSEDEYRKNFNGRTNADVLEHVYQKKLSVEETSKYALEKEAIYRELYQPHIKPVEGLLELLEAFYKRNVPMAIATSGIQVNIDFMFSHLPIKKYFSAVVNSSHIKKGKPNPEIYLQTAFILGIPPKHCLVFEDATVGVNAGKAAGMKVVALTTTHPKEELTEADLIVPDFTPGSFAAIL